MPGRLRSRPASFSRRLLSLAVVAASVAFIAAPALALPKRGKKRAPEPAETGVNVTYTGFRMLKDGRSLLYVELTGKVPVSVQKHGKQVTYVLDGAHVGVRNNQNPLLTSGFASVLESARWLSPRARHPHKKGAQRPSRARTPPQPLQLILNLRNDVTPTHAFRDAPAGAVLEITLPALRAK
jgi:hypothetical protein